MRGTNKHWLGFSPRDDLAISLPMFVHASSGVPRDPHTRSVEEPLTRFGLH